MRNPGDKKTLIFHIGLEKTGTTSFQRFCKEHRAELMRRSVLYPTNTLAYSRYTRSHEPLAACYIDRYYSTDSKMISSGCDRVTVVRSLQGEIEQTSAKTILISSEHLSSRFASAQIEELAADFSSYDCRIVVVVREHSARICSAYSTAVASGQDLTFDEFFEQILAPGSIYTRYKETIMPWEYAFGKRNIDIIIYEEGNNIVDELARGLDLTDMMPILLPSYSDNKSPDTEAIEALRLCNKHLSIEAGKATKSTYVQYLIRQDTRDRIRKLLSAASGPRSRHRQRLSEPNFKRLNDIIEIDACWLEGYGIDLPRQDKKNPRIVCEVKPEAEDEVSELLAKALIEKCGWGGWTELFNNEAVSKVIQWILSR